MHVTVARPFNIVGAGIGPGLFLGDMLRRIDQSMKTDSSVVLRVGNLQAKRDFIAVEDTVDAYVRLLEGPTSGEVFNICSGVARSMQHVLDLLVKIVPLPVTVRVDPALYKAVDVPISFGSFAKAAHTIGFQPRRDLATSVAQAWRHYWGNGKHE
jgi:GDP-4-dehydro-6-deoxy-D-mannose reductase